MLTRTEIDAIEGLPRQNDAIVDEPEQAMVLRMTNLVEYLFRVPVAYVALLQSDLKVVTRIGSGQQYWKSLKHFPVAAVLAQPVVWQTLPESPAAGTDFGNLKFVATAPLRSSDGLELGLLVIADTAPKPFSQKDREALAEFAGVLAGKMELRTMACHARESEFSRREAESRFRNIANSAPVMIISSGVDNGCSFVNKAWLDFTGRSLEEELGDGYAETFHPDHRERIIQAYWKAFQERRPLTMELPMRRHDGEYRRMRASGVPRLLDSGDCAGYIGCLTDLTDARTALSESGVGAERNKPDIPA